ncbi:MAG: DNA-directed RNA polymerase subunit L [Thermoplasmatales archaeon]|nr:DNA-directed RNA polymerase subunit L [Thermoplasmatales archaeon]
MELKVVSKDKNSIEIEMDSDETFINPLKEKLLLNSNVDTAICRMGHPLLDKPRIFVQVKKGKPSDAIAKAVKALENDIKSFKASFEKAEKQ